MDNILLGVICSGFLLLAVAFALATTPAIKSPVTRLIHHRHSDSAVGPGMDRPLLRPGAGLSVRIFRRVWLPKTEPVGTFFCKPSVRFCLIKELLSHLR